MLRPTDLSALSDLQRGRARTVADIGVSCAIMLGIHGQARIDKAEQTVELTREGKAWRQTSVWAA